MSRCQHKMTRAYVRWTYLPGTRTANLPADAFGGSAEIACRECVACGEYLSLGESDEAAVAVEVRAAVLEGAERAGNAEWRRVASAHETAGWISNPNHTPDGDEELAGWLAKQIFPVHDQHSESDSDAAPEDAADATCDEPAETGTCQEPSAP